MKTIKVIDLFNEITNGRYDEIKQMKMYYQNRRIYYDKSLGCNLGSIRFCDTNKKVVYSDMNLLEEIKIKEDILDEKEKEYLRGVIKPFRDRVVFIKKGTTTLLKNEYIEIGYRDDSYPQRALFPSFKCNTMYKNMESNKEYTLEELGI